MLPCRTTREAVKVLQSVRSAATLNASLHRLFTIGGSRFRSFGTNSSLGVPSASVPGGSGEELGWLAFRVEVLRYVPASSDRRRLHLTDDTGRCLARALTSSFVMKSLYLMPRIFLMHLLSKASSFCSWVDFKRQFIISAHQLKDIH